MFLKALISVFIIIHVVSGQADRIESECHILQSLDELKTQIDQQNIQIATLQTSLTDAASERDQQNIQIATLQTSLTKTEAEIDTLKSYMTEPHVKPDVVFHVRDVDGQPSPNNVIKFLNVVTNTDDVYDLTTGCFTTPRAGTYWFSAHVCTLNVQYYSTSIYVRGVLTSRTRVGDDAWKNCGSVAAVTVLETDDTVCLKSGPFQSVGNIVWVDANSQFNHFMGAMIN